MRLGGTATEGGHLTLLRIFVAASAVVLAVGALILGWLLTSSAQDQALLDSEVTLTEYVDGVLGTHLLESDSLAVSNDAEQLIERSLRSRPDVLSVKVWQPDGVLTWTNLAKERIGQQFPTNHHLDDVIASGEADAELESLGHEEDAVEASLGVNDVVEVYAPITDAGGNVVGAYEIYANAERVEAFIGTQKRDIWIATAGVFGALWLLFVGLVRGASRALTRRTASLAERTDELAEALSAERVARSAAERAEAEVRSRERYRVLVEHSPDTIAVLQEGQIVFANPAGLRLFGAERDEDVVGRAVSELIAPDSQAAVESMIEHLIDAGEATPFGEERFRRLDGSQIDVEVAARLTTYQGEPATQLVLRDVTERRQAERERTKLEEQLRQAQKMEAVGQLAGGIAHDFNNLLTAITASSEFLLTDLESDHPLREEAQEINVAAGRAGSLTQQLLAFSRKQMLLPEVLDVNDVVSEMNRMLRRLIGTDVELETVAPDGLWSVTADRGQLEQVLVNLSLNARDAMPAGGRLTVETANRYVEESEADEQFDLAPGRYVCITVTDTGVGMSQETQAHAFEPFFTTKDVGKGTGLGLATVHGIVNQSDGRVEVASELGRGTTVTVYLPARDEDSHEEMEPNMTYASGERGTIMLAEDDALVRRVASKSLTRQGFLVIEAASGTEALEIVRNHTGPVDLLVTDVVMPGMRGTELATELRRARPNLKVLYMSGYTGDAMREQGVPPDSEFLAKPFTQVEIARKVSLLICDDSDSELVVEAAA
ncbi:MAG: PAS domain S-box protein [Gaiellaceae bacterium]